MIDHADFAKQYMSMHACFIVPIMRCYKDLFSYLDIDCTLYHLKYIMFFPVAKLHTLHFVSFNKFALICTYILDQRHFLKCFIPWRAFESPP